MWIVHQPIMIGQLKFSPSCHDRFGRHHRHMTSANATPVPSPPSTQTPPSSPSTHLSLFAQIESELRQRILSNLLPAGSKLPSELELEAEFGVSRITVRQALAALHAGGLIRKINGKGSFVTQPGEATNLGPLTGFYEYMRAQGRKAHGRTVSTRPVRASAVHAEALRIAVGTPLDAVTVLRLVDGTPLAVGITVGEPALMRALLAEDIENNDTMTLLESRLGHRLKTMHVETSAIAAGKVRGRQLDVALTAPLLRIRFTPHDTSDRPLCWSEMYFRGDGFSYKAVVRR